MLGSELRTSPPFYVIGQSAHRFPGDFDAFAPVDRRFGDIDGSEDFHAAAFFFDPKRHRRPHRILRALEPAAIDGLPDKILLFGSKLDLHQWKLFRATKIVKVLNDFNIVA
jgi:hypothetical protein